MTISAQHTAETEPWNQVPLEQVILRLPVGPAQLPLAADEQPAPDLEELGSYGSCHICWGAGIIEDFDGDRDCVACNGTGDIEQGDSRTERPPLNAAQPQIGTAVRVVHEKTIVGAGQTITPDLIGRLDESTLHLGGRFAAVTWPNVDFVVIQPFNELVAA